MKSIKQQFLDLKEGRMNQAQFMRNVRMSLPHLVTNVTSFNDTVKILKNKAILTEVDIYGIAGNPEAEAEMRAGGQSIKPKQTPEEKYGVDQKIDQSELNFLKKIYAKTPTDKIKQMIDNLENRMKLSESYTTNTSGKELYSKFAEIDNLNGQEVLIGIDYEIEKNSDLTKKEATKIVIKNLKKNPFYYTDSLLAGKEGAEAEYMNKLKPGSDQMKDIKGGDLVDKANGMTSPKNIEKVKASANKANKETNKPEAGIKLMSLVAKTVRGVKKMDPTGEKMKKLNLKESPEDKIGKIVDQIYSELQSMGTYDSNDKANLINKYDLSNDEKEEVEFRLFDMDADERYMDDTEDIDEGSALPGGDNMTDVAGHQMDEAKAGSLSVGDKFKIAANLGKFVKDEEVEVVSLEPFGNDIKLVLSNGKDKDDFYLDRNDEI